MRCTQDQSQANMDIIYTGSDLLKSNNHTSNIKFVEYVFASYFFDTLDVVYGKIFII
jgi:hypothetical protein